MSLSARDVTQLRSLLSRLSVSQTPKPKRKRRRNRAKASANVPAGYARATNPARGTMGGGPMGEIVVSRSERLCAVTAQKSADSAGLVALYPTSEAMAWLAKLLVAFDRIEWLTVSLEWRPFVGTQRAGSIAYSMDWDSSLAAADVNRVKVQSGTPVYECPIWQSGRMHLPTKMLMTRRSYAVHATEKSDRQPGNLIWALAGADADGTVGEIWITYKVRLSGTTA